MLHLPLIAFMLIYQSPTEANETDLDCDIDIAQEKSLSDLTRNLSYIEKKMKEKDPKKKQLGIFECQRICDDTYYKYHHLTLVVYRNYRTYLNDFLTEAVKDSPAIKRMLKLTDYFRNGDGQKLMKQNKTDYLKAENHTGKDGTYEFNWKLKEKAQDTEDKLGKLLYSRYKTLRKSIGDKHKVFKDEILPLTEHTCKTDRFGAKMDKQKSYDLLISKTPQLSIRNVCSDQPYDYVDHPTQQSTILFQTQEGRAMVWYCKQSFTQSPVKQGRGNWGPYSETMVHSKAGCIAYDLLNQRFMLGDQKQTHVHYEPDRYIKVADARIEMAKELGKIPLSYAEFIKQNPKMTPLPAKQFFEKIIPKNCQVWRYWEDNIKRAEGALLKAETGLYNGGMEY